MLNINATPAPMYDTLQPLGFTTTQIAYIRKMFEPHSFERLVLVSGQSGSGKSTTVKHLAEYLLECQPSLNIFSVEYNPEYSIRGVAQNSGEEYCRLCASYC